MAHFFFSPMAHIYFFVAYIFEDNILYDKIPSQWNWNVP